MKILLAIALVSLDHPVTYIRAPRPDSRQGRFPMDIGRLYRTEPGAEMCLLRPGEEPVVLVDASNGPIIEQRPSLDGKAIYYVRLDPQEWPGNVRPSGGMQGGSEILRYDLETGESATIHSEPGINYLSPIELPGGLLAYTSNERKVGRDIFRHELHSLYVSKLDGSEPRLMSQHQLAALVSPEYDPVPETGQVRLLSSLHERQARRNGLLWSVWSHAPDFADWFPVWSAFQNATAYHFHGSARDADGAFWRFTVGYYQVNNAGFGRLYVAPRTGTGQDFEHVGSVPSPNGEGLFAPVGRVIATPWATSSDQASAKVDGSELRGGKVTHPSASPDGQLLLTWSPGPVNSLNRPSPEPFIQSGIYAAPLGVEIPAPEAIDGEVVPVGMERVVDDPAFNEYMPRAVASFEELYGFEPEEYDFEHVEAYALPGE